MSDTDTENSIYESTERLSLREEFPPTFNFPLSEDRKHALRVIESPDQTAAIEMLRHPDMVIRIIGGCLITDTERLKSEGRAMVLKAAMEMFQTRAFFAMRQAEDLARKLWPESQDLLNEVKKLGYDFTLVPAATMRDGFLKILNAGMFPESRRKEVTAIISKDLLSSLPFDADAFVSDYPLMAVDNGTVARTKLMQVKDLLEYVNYAHLNPLVGITVGGSITKGYAVEGSDYDICFLGISGASSFTRGLSSTEYGLAHWNKNYLMIDENNGSDFECGSSDELFNPMFQGVYIGDRKRLRDIQRVHIAHISEKDWEVERMAMLKTETYIDKIRTRFDVPDALFQKMHLLIAARRIPPTLSEMKQLL